MIPIKPDAVFTEYAVDRLERDLFTRLITGEFRPGEFLPNTPRLAKARGVSQTTMRAALGRLTSRGFLTFVPGRGHRIEELLESCDLSLMMMIISEKSDAARALELEAQLLDLMSIVLIEVAYRAAGTRSDEHLKWFDYYLRIFLDRIDQDCHAAYLADTQLQLLRVLAGAAGSVAFTVVLNSFRSYLLSCAALQLFPVETWTQMAEAFEKRDVGRARAIFQRCFDRRTAQVLEELARMRGGGGNGGGSGAGGSEAPATVELAPPGDEL